MGEQFPIFDRDCISNYASADLCIGTRHDMWAGVKNFTYNGGIIIAPSGGFFYYPKYYDSSWSSYSGSGEYSDSTATTRLSAIGLIFKHSCCVYS